MPSKKYCSEKLRHQVLARIRNTKMARSSHAFVRGSTHKFYEWLESARSAKIPQGPSIWICGDCHIGNLGPDCERDGRHRNSDSRFDQTVNGNPAMI
jgi:uncharacterized protein (DUF2252 family)